MRIIESLVIGLGLVMFMSILKKLKSYFISLYSKFTGLFRSPAKSNDVNPEASSKKKKKKAKKVKAPSVKQPVAEPLKVVEVSSASSGSFVPPTKSQISRVLNGSVSSLGNSVHINLSEEKEKEIKDYIKKTNVHSDGPSVAPVIPCQEQGITKKRPRRAIQEPCPICKKPTSKFLCGKCQKLGQEDGISELHTDEAFVLSKILKSKKELGKQKVTPDAQKLAPPPQRGGQSSRFRGRGRGSIYTGRGRPQYYGSRPKGDLPVFGLIENPKVALTKAKAADRNRFEALSM